MRPVFVGPGSTFTFPEAQQGPHNPLSSAPPNRSVTLASNAIQSTVRPKKVGLMKRLSIVLAVILVVYLPCEADGYTRNKMRYNGGNDLIHFAATGAAAFATQGGMIYAAGYPGANWGAKVTAALADVPASGGVVDARGLTGNQSLSSDLMISKRNTTILLGPMNLSMGSNRFLISAGTNGVKIQGVGAWGGSGGANNNNGTYFSYTGIGSAVVVGDSTLVTQMLHLADFAINLSGSGAIGITLNVVQFSDFERLRIAAPSSGGTAGTQILIKSDGNHAANAANYNGFLQFKNLWLSNGLTGILLYDQSNSNQIIGGNYAGIIGTSVAIDIQNGDTNGIYGMDIENALIGVKFSNSASNNYFPMVRFETVATIVSFASGCNFNYICTSSGGMVSDSGTWNTVIDPSRLALSYDAIKLRNQRDTMAQIVLGAGRTADQYAQLTFRDKTGGNVWSVAKDSTNLFNVIHEKTSVTRLQFNTSNSFIDSESGGALLVNAQHGTGGMVVFDGTINQNHIFDTTPTGGSVATVANRATNTADSILTLRHNSSGVPTSSFGSRLLWQAQTTTTANRNAAAMDAIWTTATEGSQVSNLVVSLVKGSNTLTEIGRWTPSGITLASGKTLTVAGGTAIAKIATYSASLTPAGVSAHSCVEQTFTVPGVESTDIVVVNKPTAQVGLGIAGVRASGTNQVGINFCNVTGAKIIPTAGETYHFSAIR